MKWKAQLIEIHGDAAISKQFQRIYLQAVMKSLKEMGELSPMQYRRAMELVEQL